MQIYINPVHGPLQAAPPPQLPPDVCWLPSAEIQWYCCRDAYILVQKLKVDGPLPFCIRSYQVFLLSPGPFHIDLAQYGARVCLHYTLAGKAEGTLDQLAVDFEPQTYNIYYVPGESHYRLKVRNNHHLLQIDLSSPLLSVLSESDPDTGRLEHYMRSNTPKVYAHIRGISNARLQASLGRLWHYTEERFGPLIIFIPQWVLKLLGLYIRELHGYRKALQSKNPKIDQELIPYIKQNLHRNLTIPILSKRALCSQSKIREDFHAHIGRSLGSYILDIRMQEAAVYLEETDETLDNIAEKLNYADASTFIYAFKRFYQVTPGQYREQQQKK